jgi:predicted GIY-YIG superfamily endonuclease
LAGVPGLAGRMRSEEFLKTGINMDGQNYLVVQHLENISWQILEEYPEIINNFIKDKSGIYALYNKDKLYYIGLATNLKQRLKIHLKDRHKGLWERFSVYLTVQDEHMKELETLLLRITLKPKGNRISGSFSNSKNLKADLSRTIKEIDNRRRAIIIDGKKDVKKSSIKVILKKGDRSPVKIDKSYELKCVYKGKIYRGKYRKNGKIFFNGKEYNAPSTASFAVTGTSVDGWYFWKYKNEKGEWIKLDELRR